jgi:hypothetical protein
VPKLTRNRLKRVFSDLGFHKPESDDIPGLDDHVLGQLVGMAAESQGFTMLEPGEPTERLRRLVADFALAVRKALTRWGLRHEAWLKLGEDGEELYYDDGPYAVLMTLRGEGVGVTDGRWDHHFKAEHVTQALGNLKVTLQKELRRWADDTGGGVLTAHIDKEGERQGRAQNPEVEEVEIEVEDPDEDDEDEAEDEDEGDEGDEDGGSERNDGEPVEAPERGHEGESFGRFGYAHGRAPRSVHRGGVPAPYIAPPRRRR